MASLQPIDTASSGSPLNPPIYKTFIPKSLIQPNAVPEGRRFFDANRYETSVGTEANAFDSNPIRSFAFITDQLIGQIF